MDIVGMDNSNSTKKKVIFSIIGVTLALAIAIPIVLFNKDNKDEDIDVNNNISIESNIEDTSSEISSDELAKINNEEQKELYDKLIVDIDLGEVDENQGKGEQIAEFCTLEIQNQMTDINNYINKNIENGGYYGSLLKEVITNIESGNLDIPSSFKSILYKDYIKVISYYINKYPDQEFEMTINENEVSDLYNSIITNSLYKEDFSSMNSQQIEENVDNPTIFDNYESIINFYFNNNDKNYKAYFSMVNGSLKLLDVEIIEQEVKHE